MSFFHLVNIYVHTFKLFTLGTGVYFYICGRFKMMQALKRFSFIHFRWFWRVSSNGNIWYLQNWKLSVLCTKSRSTTYKFYPLSALSNLPLKPVLMSPTKPLKPSIPGLHNIYYKKISPNMYPQLSLMQCKSTTVYPVCHRHRRRDYSLSLVLLRIHAFI